MKCPKCGNDAIKNKSYWHCLTCEPSIHGAAMLIPSECVACGVTFYRVNSWHNHKCDQKKLKAIDARMATEDITRVEHRSIDDRLRDYELLMDEEN